MICAQAMPTGGVAYFNCGEHSGASQPHKHLQVRPHRMPFGDRVVRMLDFRIGISTINIYLSMLCCSLTGFLDSARCRSCRFRSWLGSLQ